MRVFQLNVEAITHRGRLRVSNEDAVSVGGWCSDSDGYGQHRVGVILQEPWACAVADGVGGRVGGATASAMTVQAVAQADWTSVSVERLEQLVRDIDASMFLHMDGNATLAGMASTLAGMLFTPTQALIFNVGDSRAYEWRGPYLRMLSQDDRVTDARDRAVLTQALGGLDRSRRLVPHVRALSLRAGQAFVLVTDGVTDELTVDQMEAAIAAGAGAEGLSESVLAAGARDNFSVVTVRVQEMCGDE